MTKIIAKKDLFNGGKCFTKGKIYQTGKTINTQSDLMGAATTNDLGEPHFIGNWWKNFKVLKS